MPLPAPAPTVEQLVIVSEITLLPYDVVLAMVSADTQLVADAKWARTLVDIDTWGTVVSDAGDIKRVGSIEFFEGTIGISRLAFRNKLLARYGQILLLSEILPSIQTVSSLVWF